MRVIIILTSLCMLVGNTRADFPVYGAPQPQQYQSSSYGAPQPSSGYGAPSGGQIHKHVYVHVAPDEPQEIRIRSYKPHPPPEKHYKIIFIKAPTPPPQEQQEIELPPHPEQKTLVYVLLRKPEAAPEVKIHPAPPVKPTKPEVYFIRYKNQETGGYGAPQIQSQYGAPIGPAPGGQYGAPY